MQYVNRQFDCVLVKNGKKTIVNTENILSKCKWSPLEGKIFSNSVEMTFLNGKKVFDKGVFSDKLQGEKLKFL